MQKDVAALTGYVKLQGRPYVILSSGVKKERLMSGS